MTQAIYLGAIELGYETYLLPIFIKDEDKRYQIIMLNPQSSVITKLRGILLDRNSKFIINSWLCSM